MFVKLLEDLRFVIGLYFSIVSLILFSVSNVESPEHSIPLNLNLYGAIYVGGFSLVMLGLSLWSNRALFSVNSEKNTPRIEKSEILTAVDLSETS